MNETTVLAELMAQLRGEYVADWPRRAAELETHIGDSVAGDAAARERVVTAFHQLAGSGASYGFPAVSAVARRIEQRLRSDTAIGADELREAVATIGRTLHAEQGVG